MSEDNLKSFSVEEHGFSAMKKICSKCHVEKLLTEFYGDKRRRDGHDFSCKVCKEKVRRIRTGAQRSTNGTPERFWARVDMGKDCWPWIGSKDKDGYGKTTWKGKGHVRTHVLAWFLTHGVWPALLVCHTCDNPSCSRPDHLFEGTNQENMQDSRKKGRLNHGKTRGENHYRSVLTGTAAKEIRKIWETGQYTQAALQRITGHTRKVIYNLVRNITYR